MYETTKAYPRRAKRGYLRLLTGCGIDIGAGDDPLVVDGFAAERYDVEQGDAQYMAEELSNSYDFVYSSHCLEHMRDVHLALFHWVRILRPGGTLCVVVPDYELYEHEHWPSRYNAEHLQSFSLTKSRYQVGRSNHHHIPSHIVPILHSLGIQNLCIELEDDNYEYNMATEVDQTLGAAMAQILILGQKNG
jgi:predicted SAM-dependent methyltransferase